MNKMGVAILWAGALVVAQVSAPPLAARTAPQYQDRSQSRYARSRPGQRLTGTYELDRTRSDDPLRASDQVLRQLPVAERSRVHDRLMNRLDPPDILSLERAGLQMSIASSRAPQLSFEADGRSRTEMLPSGRSLTTRASLSGDRLDVSTRGQSGIDFTVTFEPIDYGSSLRVTRQLFDERLRQPVVVRSVYRKISDAPDWDVYSGPRGSVSGRYDSPSSWGSMVIPDGATLVATLDQPVDMRAIRQNDRVTLTVRNAPRAEWQNAVIEGSVVNMPAAMNDRSGLTIAFDQIRLRDGRTGNFDGTIDAIRGPNGESIAYDAEQVRSGNNQTERAVQRGAIGAALGAAIGAIAGGGKGAAIGAIVGGGGGAATVFIDPSNQSNLPRGTEFTIHTRTPIR